MEEFIKTYRGLNGRSYTAETKSFGGGGEGYLFNLTNDPDKVIKVYRPTIDTNLVQAKLRVMLTNPPDRERKKK